LVDLISDFASELRSRRAMLISNSTIKISRNFIYSDPNDFSGSFKCQVFMGFENSEDRGLQYSGGKYIVFSSKKELS